MKSKFKFTFLSLSIGFILFAYYNIQIENNIENYDLNLQSLLVSSIANADGESGPGDCCDNGYRQWNSTYVTLSGKDCWCDDREKVYAECTNCE